MDSLTPSEKHRQIKQHYAESKARMVRKLLALGYQMGFDKPHNPTEEKMKPWQVNKKHINAWLLSDHSTVRKEMDDMTHHELNLVVTQFEQVYQDFLKRL